MPALTTHVPRHLSATHSPALLLPGTTWSASTSRPCRTALILVSTMQQHPTLCACQSYAPPWGACWDAPLGCLCQSLPSRCLPISLLFCETGWPLPVGLPCDVQDSSLQVTAHPGMAACLAESSQRRGGTMCWAASASRPCSGRLLTGAARPSHKFGCAGRYAAVAFEILHACTDIGCLECFAVSSLKTAQCTGTSCLLGQQAWA